jgi:hypothetical protein
MAGVAAPQNVQARGREIGAIDQEVVEALIEDALAPVGLELAVDGQPEQEVPQPGGVEDVRVEQRNLAGRAQYPPRSCASAANSATALSRRA